MKRTPLSRQFPRPLSEYGVAEGFAGPGGWSEALRIAQERLGIDVGPSLGVEWNADACATARAAGHDRVQADVSRFDLSGLSGVRGVGGAILSPPCPPYSTAGNGKGKLDRPRIEQHIALVEMLGVWVPYSRDGWHDPRSALTLEPLRWAMELRPEWIALEQVPGALPLYEAIGRVLDGMGYFVAVGVLSAEEFGVPQTRKRAFLIATTCGPVSMPAPTHRAYRKGRARHEGDAALLPWVSMADALGHGMTERPSMTVTGGGSHTGGAEPFGNGARQSMARELAEGRYVQRSNYSDSPTETRRTSQERGRAIRTGDEPSVTMTPKTAQWLATGTRPNSTKRATTEPAPGLAFGNDAASLVWMEGDRPSPAEVIEAKFSKANAVRVTYREGGVLQSFPWDYPWNGGPKDAMGPKYHQVGDAVPPVLGAAVLVAVLSVVYPED